MKYSDIKISDLVSFKYFKREGSRANALRSEGYLCKTKNGRTTAFFMEGLNPSQKSNAKFLASMFAR